MKIESFRDLIAWKEGNNLVIQIYRLTTKYPVSEQFGITNRMRRAAVSVTSNIAEGFVRKAIKEKSQFYYIALGSVSELQNQLIISSEIGYIKLTEFNQTSDQTNLVGKSLNGLIKSTLSRS